MTQVKDDNTGVANSEGNKLIAEFMGMQSSVKGHYRRQTSPWVVTLPQYLEYHSSWDWLMPVVKKIEETESKVFYDNNSPFCEMLLNTPIQRVWEVVVEFIQWHNYSLSTPLNSQSNNTK